MFIAFNSQKYIIERTSSFVRYNWRFFVDLSKKRLVLYQLPVFHKNVFKASNSNFKERLIDRGYPQTMIENLLSDIKFTERESALLKHNNKEEKEILPFVTQYQPSVSTLKEVLMKKWNLIQNQPLLRQIFKEPPIISNKKGKSLKDMLVRAKI